MIHREISPEEAGRKLVRYLEILLPKAPRSFIFKAIRSNRIKINGKHPKDEKLVLNTGDQIDLFLTDEQLEDFGCGKEKTKHEPSFQNKKFPDIPIIYEDDRILIVDKPVGIATQKGPNDPVSLTEMMREYISSNSGKQSLSSYHPSFCHRLDKNTSGLLIMAKTLQAHQAIERMLKERLIRKYYLAVVRGRADKWKEETRLVHCYQKDPKTNQAVLSPWRGEGIRCESSVLMIDSSKDQSVVRVDLLTGKSHQIRAQLAYEGFPIMGDGKYDHSSHIFRQQLSAYELFFEKTDPFFDDLRGKHFYSHLSDSFENFNIKNRSSR